MALAEGRRRVTAKRRTMSHLLAISSARRTTVSARPSLNVCLACEKAFLREWRVVREVLLARCRSLRTF
jgi:hypothetical protein